MHSAAIDRINTHMQTEIQNHKTKAQNRTNGLDSLFPSKCKFIRSGLVRWGCWKRKPHTLIQCTTSNIGLTRWGRWKKNQHSLNLTRSFLIPKRRSQSSRGCRPFLFYFWETITWNPKIKSIPYGWLSTDARSKILSSIQMQRSTALPDPNTMYSIQIPKYLPKQHQVVDFRQRRDYTTII